MTIGRIIVHCEGCKPHILYWVGTVHLLFFQACDHRILRVAIDFINYCSNLSNEVVIYWCIMECKYLNIQFILVIWFEGNIWIIAFEEVLNCPIPKATFLSNWLTFNKYSVNKSLDVMTLF